MLDQRLHYLLSLSFVTSKKIPVIQCVKELIQFISPVTLLI